MRQSFFAVLVLLAACGGPDLPASPGDLGTSEDDVKAVAPIPFVLQFTGTYNSQNGGTVKLVELHRNGTYFAAFSSGSWETGTYRGPSSVPNGFNTWSLKLRSRSGTRWTATLDGYSSPTAPTQLTWSRKGYQDSLVLDRPAIADEGLCDDTAGQWTDDEPAANGLFCICPQGQDFIPSLGGCTS